jgi:hypothetical protein
LQKGFLRLVAAPPAEANRRAQVDDEAMAHQDVLLVGIRRHPMYLEGEVVAPACARARQHNGSRIGRGVTLPRCRVQKCDGALSHAKDIAEYRVKERPLFTSQGKDANVGDCT